MEESSEGRQEDMLKSEEERREYAVDNDYEEQWEQRQWESAENIEVLYTYEDSSERKIQYNQRESNWKEEATFEHEKEEWLEDVHGETRKNVVHDQLVSADSTVEQHDKETIFQRLRRQAKLLQQEKALHNSHHSLLNDTCNRNSNIYNCNWENYDSTNCWNKGKGENNWVCQCKANNDKHVNTCESDNSVNKHKTKLSWAEWSAFEARNWEYIYAKQMNELIAQSSLPEHVTFHPHTLTKSAKLDEQRYNRVEQHSRAEHEQQQQHEENNVYNNCISDCKTSSCKNARWQKLYKNASETAARRKQYLERLQQEDKAERTKSHISPASVQWLVNSETSGKLYNHSFINRQELYAQKSAKQKEALQQSLETKYNNKENMHYNDTHKMQSNELVCHSVKSNLFLSSSSESSHTNAPRLATSKQNECKKHEYRQVESEQTSKFYQCKSVESNHAEHSHETCNLSSEVSEELSPTESSEKSQARENNVHSSANYKTVTELNAQLMYEREMNAATAKAERIHVQQKRKILTELLQCTFRPCINENVACKGSNDKWESVMQSSQVAGVDEFLWRQGKAQQMKQDLEWRKRTISEGKVCKFSNNTLTQLFAL